MFATDPKLAHAEDMRLSSALLVGRSARPLPVYDDWYGPLFVYGQEYGPIMLIRAASWESAYEIAIDESPTIDAADVPEAYGYWIFKESGRWHVNDENDDERAAWPTTYATRAAAESAALEHASETERDLQEGYQYQSNSTGTGIVHSGYYEWLDSLDAWHARGMDRVLPIFTYC